MSTSPVDEDVDYLGITVIPRADDLWMTWGFAASVVAGGTIPRSAVIPSLWTAKSPLVDSLVERG